MFAGNNKDQWYKNCDKIVIIRKLSFDVFKIFNIWHNVVHV